MESSERNLDSTSADDEQQRLNSREDAADRCAVGVSLLVLCFALVLATLWEVERPSFARCSALDNATERHACYDQLRSERLKPPAKGGYFR
jgi:hypothetical protein